MKILMTTLLCLCLSLPVLADQQTTVLTEQTSVGKATAMLPYIDGSNSAELEKQANALVRDAAAKLVKEVGGQGSVTYKVMLNRPSLVSLLLEADNGGRKAYTGLNLDLTTGKEFEVTYFFVDNDNVKMLWAIMITCFSAKRACLCAARKMLPTVALYPTGM